MDEIKYAGKGFSESLQTILAEAIQDASIYYKDNPHAQSNYISKQLKANKPGQWHVIIVQELNISKITEVSTGFSYWNENDTWALWFNTSAFAKNVLHLLIYNGEEEKSTTNVSTKTGSVGPDVNS